MMYQTTGSTCSPGGRSRAPGRAAAVLVVALTILATGLLARPATAAPVVDGIFCGMPLARRLASGATDTFVTSLLPGTVVSTNIIAPAGDPLFKLQSGNFSPATATCAGELLLTTIADDMMAPLPGTINVTSCFDPTAAGDYTITLSVVSAGPDNCAVPLPCGMPLNASFATPGEVDSYTFPGSQGDTVTLAVTNVDRAIGQVHLRLFDPSGAPLADDPANCPSSLHMRLPASGAYTLLVSACTGAPQGHYTVTWSQQPSCTAKQPPGQLAYVTNADSGTMSVVDLSTNSTKLTMPIAPLGQAEVASLTFVAITPNGGFTWATYEHSSSAAVVNTSTNLLTASVPSGLDANGIAISPDGALAYVVSNSLGGIVLVDTKTNKPTRVVGQQELQSFLQGAATATTQDGTFLYVVAEDSSGLAKINTIDYSVDFVTTYDLGLYDAFAVSPDASFIYVGTLTGIARIDTQTNILTDNIELGEPFAIAFTADGGRAYATLADTSVVAVIDTATKTVVDTIPGVGDSPGGIAISPETGLAYVTDFTAAANEPGVFVIDTKTNRVIASLPTLGDGPTAIALTTAPAGLCVGDTLGETKVTVDEIVLSLNYLLHGCPGRFPSLSVPFP